MITQQSKAPAIHTKASTQARTWPRQTDSVEESHYQALKMLYQEPSKFPVLGVCTNLEAFL